MYPDNLKGKATLWLWYLRDIGIIGVGAIIGVIAISHADFYLPMAIAGCYAFLTIRMQDTSIFDYLSYAFGFFIFARQTFYWRYSGERELEGIQQSWRKWRMK